MSGSPPPQVVSRPKEEDEAELGATIVSPLMEELGATIESPWIVVGGSGSTTTSLFLFSKEEEEPAKFFPLTRMRSTHDDITQCHGSGGGWLAMCRNQVSADGKILPYLIDPLSNRMIQLPPLQQIPSIHRNVLWKNTLRFNILAYPNGGGLLVTVVDRCIRNQNLSYCRLQGGRLDAAAAEWVHVKKNRKKKDSDYDGFCVDMAFFKGNLYALYQYGDIVCFMFDSNGVFTVASVCDFSLPAGVQFDFEDLDDDAFLVESKGELLMVLVKNHREESVDDGSDDVLIAVGCDVYKAERGAFVKLSGLGERSIFLSWSTNVCLDVSRLEASGYRNNCIYNTCHRKFEWCQFSLDDNNFIDGPPPPSFF